MVVFNYSQPVSKSIPAFFSASFLVDSTADTFLKLDKSMWSKGVAFINGINLGRYWPARGPQNTLYVPKPFLRSQSNNQIWIFELEPKIPPTSITSWIEFVSQPELAQPIEFVKDAKTGLTNC